MDKKSLLFGATALLVVGLTVASLPKGIPSSARLVAALEAMPGNAQWYRGNLHTHSTASDGDAGAGQVAAWYRTHGYQFLVLTDHDVLSPPPPAGAPDGLLLRGEELSDAVGSTSVHLGMINANALVRPQGKTEVLEAMQADADAGREAGAVVQVNHPNYTWSITAEQLMRLRGVRLFEVFNGHPLARNTGDGTHPSTERMWDIALAFRLTTLHLPLLYGTASDDAHNYGPPSSDAGSPGRGWVVVLANRLAPEAIAAALQAGQFYASTGVRLERILLYDRGLRVQVAAEPGVTYRIEFIGTRRGFDARSKPATTRAGTPAYGTRRYSDNIGRVLSVHEGTSADYVFDPDDLYVRARITASRRHPNPSQPMQFEQAWVEPVLGPGAAAAPPGPGIVAPTPTPVALHDALLPRFQKLDQAGLAALQKATTPDCSLDLFGGANGQPGDSFAQRDHIAAGGWFADRTRATVPDSVGMLLRGGSSYLAEAPNGVSRPDVAKALGKPELEGAGFNMVLPLERVAHDQYDVLLVGWYGNEAITCATGKHLRVHAL